MAALASLALLLVPVQACGNNSSLLLALVQKTMNEFRTHQNTMIVSIIATAVLALLGNGFLVLFIMRRARELRFRSLRPVQLLILNTGLADILFALLTLCPQAIRLFMFPRWDGGDFLCRLTSYASMVPMYASSFLLVALSADRYMAVCRPLASVRHSKRGRAKQLAAAAWIGALLCSLPMGFIFRVKYSCFYQVYLCQAVYPSKLVEKANVIWFGVVAWLFPTLAASYFYTRICREVWKSLSRNKATSGETWQALDPDNKQRADYVARLRNRDSRQRLVSHMEKQRKKTVKLTLTIVACNFLLYAPFCITNVVYSLFPNAVSTVATTYIMLIGNLNSCASPWIYVFFNMRHVKDALLGGQRSRERGTNKSFDSTDALRNDHVL